MEVQVFGQYGLHNEEEEDNLFTFNPDDVMGFCGMQFPGVLPDSVDHTELADFKRFQQEWLPTMMHGAYQSDGFQPH